MSIETEPERVVVILDASRELSLSTINWALLGLSLKPGDMLILLGILHQVNNPSTLSFMGAGKLMGYRIKVDPSSMFGTNKKIIAEEMERKTEQYKKHPEIEKISTKCEREQIEFRIEMRAGSPLRVVATKAARRLRATWLVLDRHLKSDQAYLLENLSCNIVRMKKDNTVEELRGPNVRRYNHKPPAPRRSNVTYDEMIPAISSREVEARKSRGVHHISSVKEQGGEGSGEPPWHNNRNSNRASSLGYSSSHSHDEEYVTTTGLETGGEHSAQSVNESGDQKDLTSPDENQKQQNHNDDWMGKNPGDKVFRNSICSMCRNRRPKVGWMRDFTYAELLAATEGFNTKNFLSEGGFGSVYRGEIHGLKIAVKQYKYNVSLQGEKEFKSEVDVLQTARHENLVMLVGSCSEGNHRLLVYEFVCHGSLDLHLSKHARRPLSWEKRVKIALGAARGLQYLHDNNIIHRDMRPNNILVTHDFEPLLGDFGLARTHVDPDNSSETVTRVVGTLGYLAPEYAECGKVSTKTDVYSFGVVLLQLISGMKTTDKRLEGKSLVGWARPLLKDRNYPDLIDPRILDSHDVHQLFWMVRVAEKCLTRDPKKRLTMDKVVYALNYITDCDNICGSIRDFSPAQSDTQSRGSSETQSQSPCDEESSFTIETSSLSNLSQFGGKLPPSPSLSRISSASTFYHGELASSSATSHEKYL